LSAGEKAENRIKTQVQNVAAGERHGSNDQPFKIESELKNKLVEIKKGGKSAG
jgi:hypothetical protein